MNQLRPLMIVLGLLAGANTIAARVHSVSLGQWGDVLIELPAGWTADLQGNTAAGGRAIRIEPGGDVPLVLLVTPFPFPGDTEELLPSARRIAEESIVPSLRESAVEKELPIRRLDGETCRGWYVSATDRTVETPTLEDFKYVDQGVVALGSLMATFTLLTNVPDAPERRQAHDLVRTSRHVLPGPPWRTRGGGVAVSYGGRSWRLALDLPGYEVDPIQLRQHGSGVKLSGENPETGMIITVFLEESKPGWTAVDHREDAWKVMQKASPMDRADVRRGTRDAMAILEYRVPSFLGRDLNQKSVNAYLVRDGVWIDVHLSKVGFQEGEEELFEKVIASIRFEE